VLERIANQAAKRYRLNYPRYCPFLSISFSFSSLFSPAWFLSPKEATRRDPLLCMLVVCIVSFMRCDIYVINCSCESRSSATDANVARLSMYSIIKLIVCIEASVECRLSTESIRECNLEHARARERQRERNTKRRDTFALYIHTKQERERERERA